MAKTVLANGFGIAHKGGADAINVCKTPTGPEPIPIPYANMVDAQAAAGDRGAQQRQKELKTKKPGADSATQAAIFSKTNKTQGDEPGTAGGVKSSTNMKAKEFILYSFDVKYEGKNVCRMGDSLLHNKKNIAL